MNNKKLFILIFSILIFLSTYTVFARVSCPFEKEYRHILRKALIDFLTNPSKAELTEGEVKELLNFYLTEDLSTADCSGVDPILKKAAGISEYILLRCSDGTEYGECSWAKPKYCYNGNLIDKCSVCECPVGSECKSDESCTVPVTTTTTTSTTTTTIPSDLVVYYKLDEGSGTNVYDSSPYNNDGTISGATWTTGKQGKALQFDGTNDFVRIPSSSVLNKVGELTLSAWVKPSDISGWEIIFAKREGTASCQYYAGIYNDELFLRWYNSGTLRAYESSSVNLVANQWQHIAITYDDANNIIKYYKNGQYIESDTTIYSMDSNNKDLSIGSRWDDPTANPYQGSLDEVKIWNKVLTASEINEEYGVESCDEQCQSLGFANGECRAGNGGTLPVGILHVEGTKLVDENGNEVYLKGFNVDWNERRFNNGQFWTEADIKRIKESGGNCVEIHIERIGTWMPQKNQIDIAYFEQWLDKEVMWCEQNKVYCIINLRDFGWKEGYRQYPYLPDWLWEGLYSYSKPLTEAEAKQIILDFFDTDNPKQEENRQAWINAWKLVVKRYKDKNYVLFGLINEPLMNIVPSDQRAHFGRTYTTLMERTIDAIRIVGANQVIFIDYPRVGSSNYVKIQRENIVWEVHHYVTQWTDINGFKSNVDNSVQKFVNEFQQPVFVGEYSMFSPTKPVNWQYILSEEVNYIDSKPFVGRNIHQWGMLDGEYYDTFNAEESEWIVQTVLGGKTSESSKSGIYRGIGRAGFQYGLSYWHLDKSDFDFMANTFPENKLIVMNFDCRKLMPNVFESTPSYTTDSSFVSFLDNYISWCNEKGIKVIVNNENPVSWPSDYWSNNIYRNGVSECFKYLANRYTNTILGFDPVNEPWQKVEASSDSDYIAHRNFVEYIIDEFRSVNTKFIAFVQGPQKHWRQDAMGWVRDFPIRRENVYYTFHLYSNSYDDNSDWINTNPAYVDNYYSWVADYKNGNYVAGKEKLKNELYNRWGFIKDLEISYGHGIFLGEFAANLELPGGSQYLRDIISILNEWKASGSYYAWYSPEHRPMCLLNENHETLRQDLVDSLKNNNFFVSEIDGGTGEACLADETPINQDGCLSGQICCCKLICSPLNYPSDKWQRIWYVHFTGECLGDRPNEPSIKFDNDWSDGIIAYNIADDIEFRSSRTINFPTGGTYTFTVGSDDGVRFWIDDELKIDSWRDRSYKTDSINVDLTAGNHKFRIDYYENGGDARVSFSYRKTTGEYPPANVKYFSDDSYWYMKIKDNPKIHPNNDKMIEWLYNYGGNQQKHPGINWKSWTGVIYDAYEDTPLYSVLEEDAGHYHDVPFPDTYPIAIPSDADGSVTIIDWYRGDIWASWNMRATGGTYVAGDLYAFELYSDGVEELGRWTVGGSGCPAAAYRIKPEEIEAGVIHHALAGCLHSVGPYTDGSRVDSSEGFVHPPAVHTDRETTSSNPNQIPAGARIQLDPAIDLDSLGLSTTGKIIAKALQDYGMVVAESGGAWVIYAEHDLSADWNPPEMSGGLLSPIDSLWTSTYCPWRIIDFDLMPTHDDLSEYVSP
jgi:hypothetical protein